MVNGITIFYTHGWTWLSELLLYTVMKLEFTNIFKKRMHLCYKRQSVFFIKITYFLSIIPSCAHSWMLKPKDIETFSRNLVCYNAILNIALMISSGNDPPTSQLISKLRKLSFGSWTLNFWIPDPQYTSRSLNYYVWKPKHIPLG